VRIFGFDIGTTSIGFAVIDHDPLRETGDILRLGVRIFPEARDPDGTPLNQTRRTKRMVRRQLRRRRTRRRALNEQLAGLGLLPRFGSKEWDRVMAEEPLALRARGLNEALSAFEVGRALYHLAQRRHFSGRDGDEDAREVAADEKKAAESRESALKLLKQSGQTLGEFLHAIEPHVRKRGVHVIRSTVEDEFERLWAAQALHHAVLRDPEVKAKIKDTTFAQRPVFWRKSTLGNCRFMPGESLCPKGSWLSQQRRMLEKVNNLAIAGGNMRPLDADERAAILDRLQTQGSMTWGGVRAALKSIFAAKGDSGGEKRLRFNLEAGGDPTLPGNGLEAKLADIFGEEWSGLQHRQAIRDAVQQRLWDADYREIGTQRVVIRTEQQRSERRVEFGRRLIEEFGITEQQAAAFSTMKLPSGWEPYSVKALELFLPHLEAGVRFGALVSGPEWEEWRRTTFPDRDQPTGEELMRLPSPADKEEQRRLTDLRNPTVIRSQNELRKVVNNLIGMFGKPGLIRVELARDVGKSKKEREEKQKGQRLQEIRRKEATKDLRANGIEPSHDDIEKWLLWKESQCRCPYTGDQICFDALFRRGEYEVEHTWPRSRSLDDSFANKTLCRRDVNAAKGNKTPFEFFAHDPEEWVAIIRRVEGMEASKSGVGMSRGKIKRFLAREIPEGFAARQLNDTRFAARQAVGFLKRLWPDVGIEAPVTVQAVTGRVTAQLRKRWELNYILGDDGEKTRGDHRHHAVDALVVACTHQGMIQRLSAYWQGKEDPRAEHPHLSPPWPGIRADAARAIQGIVVSHRVRKKISGPLHKETVYGDTRHDIMNGKIVYREFVTRKKLEALSKGEVDDIRDSAVKEIVRKWVADHGGDPKRAFGTYPRVSADGPEIRKVRLLSKQQLKLMAEVSTGYADLGSNHHIAIYRLPNGKADFEVVSLFEASRRLAKHEPIVRRIRGDGSGFVMSLATGDALEFPAGDNLGIWIVNGAWGSGQIVLERANDAAHSTTTRPKPSTLLAESVRKISIDPIGRIRPAHD